MGTGELAAGLFEAGIGARCSPASRNRNTATPQRAETPNADNRRILNPENFRDDPLLGAAKLYLASIIRRCGCQYIACCDDWEPAVHKRTVRGCISFCKRMKLLDQIARPLWP